MKTKLILILLTFITMLCSVPAQAGTNLFNAGEWQLDANAITRTKNLNDFDSGGGVGLNYFPWRTAGMGLEADTVNTKSAFFDRIGLSLIGRLPLEAIRIAPEFRIGVQNDLEISGNHGPGSKDGVELFAGLGAEWRITQRFGLGAEVRGVRPMRGAADEYLTGILRCRLNF